MIPSIFLSVFLINFFIHLTFATVQCNFGLKLYSVEGGKAVCAPFGHYGCTESCEWNTTCTKTSHFLAFKGRRTYVSGMILTDNNFLLQCCASLGTIVQLNRKQTPLCVWTSWVNSVEMMGSLRMDPPLSKNEYIRDIMIERVPKTGKVKLRLQICKFLMQRTNCDKQMMAAEERHHYSLLLLRLSRTQLLLNSTETSSKASSEIIETAKPASALFSVVSRVDENHEIGNFVSGTTGDQISKEETKKFTDLQPFKVETTSVNPQLNTAFWDNTSGILKAVTKNPPPAGIPPPSSFNFDIIQTKMPTIQIVKRPQHASRKLSTNATREFVTRHIKARDESRTFFEEDPIKNTIQIKKIGKHEGKVMTHAIPTTTSATTPSTKTKPFSISLPPQYWKTVSVAPRPKQIAQIPKSNSIQGLFICCQNQAPGCRQLCTKNVTKDDIRHALVSQQCPPLSMTSVISCFPQFYDTTTVVGCCANSAALPKQCLALCAPNFKPTLAHLACIDHISTIVECYRDLIR